MTMTVNSRTATAPINPTGGSAPSSASSASSASSSSPSPVATTMSAPADRDATRGGVGRSATLGLGNAAMKLGEANGATAVNGNGNITTVVNNIQAPKPPKQTKPRGPLAALGQAIFQVGNLLTFGFLGGLFNGFRGQSSEGAN